MNKKLDKDSKIEVNLLYQIIEIISKSDDLNKLLHMIAKALSETLKSDSCLIYLYDNVNSTLVLRSAWPPHPLHINKIQIEKGEGITGWVAQHKKPVLIPKNASKDHRFKVFVNLPEDMYSSLLSVPILQNEKLIGVINLQNKKARKYSVSQIKLLTGIASQVSGAIEKAKLFQSASRKSKQLETIAQLSKSIVSNAYLNEILQLAVTLTAQMMNSKICSLMLYDEKTKELRIESTQSLSEEYRKKMPLKVGQSVSGKALETRQPVIVKNVLNDPLYVYPAIAKKEGLVSMIAVPMYIKNKPIGVINCYTTTEHDFTEEEIAIMQTIASQSAITIENTRLFEESETAKEALETRKIIERAKGMLMKERNLPENEAFQFIQKQAMNMRRSMREISEAILLSEGLKKT